MNISECQRPPRSLLHSATRNKPLSAPLTRGAGTRQDHDVVCLEAFWAFFAGVFFVIVLVTEGVLPQGLSSTAAIVCL